VLDVAFLSHVTRESTSRAEETHAALYGTVVVENVGSRTKDDDFKADVSTCPKLIRDNAKYVSIVELLRLLDSLLGSL
jgi:hypothetical protein